MKVNETKVNELEETDSALTIFSHAARMTSKPGTVAAEEPVIR
jgi:hypothetical protein